MVYSIWPARCERPRPIDLGKHPARGGKQCRVSARNWRFGAAMQRERSPAGGLPGAAALRDRSLAARSGRRI